MSHNWDNLPEYHWLQEFKKAHGKELLQTYQAHAIGIGWKHVRGEKTDQLALLFYVSKKLTHDDLKNKPIPPIILFTPTNVDAPVSIITDVIEAPETRFG